MAKTSLHTHMLSRAYLALSIGFLVWSQLSSTVRWRVGLSLRIT